MLLYMDIEPCLVAKSSCGFVYKYYTVQYCADSKVFSDFVWSKFLKIQIWCMNQSSLYHYRYQCHDPPPPWSHSTKLKKPEKV